ncbi:MAG: CHAT domain-containing protein [Saprospiraceae bacterium]|nr:CHAT domain-containing protein [Lewinella sp.]
MDVLFFAYAQDKNDPLPALREEDDRVNQFLTPRALQNHFIVHRDSYTTREKIKEFLILYANHLCIFSYSGHAGKDRLFLGTDEAAAAGLAQLLGRCSNLKLVVLNGCSTSGQVQLLLEHGIRVVVATNAPVGDQKAKDFAIAFYQALSQGDQVMAAFDAGIGAVELSSKIEKIDRGFGFIEESRQDEPVWGIYYQHKEDIEYRLSEEKRKPQNISFQPNTHLVATLITQLEDYSEDLMILAAREKKGKWVNPAKKRVAMLNCLPAPVAEHLRKLISPIFEPTEGYDKLSMLRLRQMSTTFIVMMELLSFTMLAQLWELFLKGRQLQVPPLSRQVIRTFLQRGGTGTNGYDFIQLIEAVKKIFASDTSSTGVDFFVPELQQIDTLTREDDVFLSSHFFLTTLYQRLEAEAIFEDEVPELCMQAEEALSTIFAELNFIARYTLASISDIDIQKYRHTPTPSFRHNIVRLIDLLGGLDRSDLVLERFTDNRSILLVKEEGSGGQFAELNLSPFIIDKNAFEQEEVSQEVSDIYFFKHFDPHRNDYVFYRVYKPEETLRASAQEYPIVFEQLNAFYELLDLHQKADRSNLS